MDDEFAPIQELIEYMPGGTRVDLESASENYSEIEILIQMAKESIRSIRQILPFKKVHKLFLIHLCFKQSK